MLKKGIWGIMAAALLIGAENLIAEETEGRPQTEKEQQQRPRAQRAVVERAEQGQREAGTPVEGAKVISRGRSRAY